MSQLSIISNELDWNKALQYFDDLDCYYSYEYGHLFAKQEKGRIYAAFFENQTTKVFYPFIKREVPFDKKENYDIVTPYGYGGPLLKGDKSGIGEFYNRFGEYCLNNSIIAETIRFHPFYDNSSLCKEFMNVEYIRKTTAVDLTASLEEIRNNYATMNKRNIRKAKKNDVSCFVAEKDEENIHTFMKMYKETMDRNSAGSYYYFDESFFQEQVQDTRLTKSFLLFAQHNNEVIAGVLVMVGKQLSHYHLGASYSKYLALKPNNLLFDFMIEFCKSQGSKALHLGGGYHENDGLFRFKTSFTNDNNFNYFVGKKIHDPIQYEKISAKIRDLYEVNEDYFPIYRGVIKRKQTSSTSLYKEEAM